MSDISSSGAPNGTPSGPWTGQPRPRSYERLWIWSALGGQEFRFGLVTSPVGALTHWTGVRTVPCIGESCELCPKQQARVKFYCGAIALQSYADRKVNWPRGRCLVELTEAARRDCPALGMPLQGIQGRILHLARLGPRANGRVSCWLSESLASAATAARPIDVRKTLVGIWGHGPQAVQQLFCQAMLQQIATIVATEGGDS